MIFLQKAWVRVIVSLLAGGFATEIMHITTGDPNRPMSTNFTLAFGLIVFIVLTYLVKNKGNK
ncbi:MAG: hypothetical protein HOP30_07545 [Cyclobacteriaceae bacterium]|nr:hypothetical protein [Cyclobacteriaceae bacterium]